MNTKKTIVLFATALIAVLVMAGSAQAQVEPVGGAVNSTVAQGEFVTLYLDVNPPDYVTVAVSDNTPLDTYYFSDISPLLSRNGIISGGSYNATVEMRCSGTERDRYGNPGAPYTNTLQNTTPSTAKWTGVWDGGPEGAPRMELKACVECSIDVNKTVWDPVNQIWEPDMLSGVVGNDYRFRCEIHNDGLNANLTNITVWDVLDPSFVYNDTAMLEFPKGSGIWIPIDPPDIPPIGWTIDNYLGPGFILQPCETIVIEFNATLNASGTDCNVQYASAECIETGQPVEDWDEVCVSTTLLDVTKTVWSKPVGAPDYNAGQWVDEVTGANISEIYRFNCTIHNIGDPGQNITELEVWDILSDSLEYANNATLLTPDGINRSIEPPTESNATYAKWIIDNFLQDDLKLLPCQSIIIEFDAHVVNYGRDENVQYARGYCGALDLWFVGEDNAWINTTAPDLIVSDITINYDGYKNKAVGPVPHPGNLTQSNNISAVIEEVNGVDVEFDFNVTFEINGEKVCTVEVPAVMAGSSTVTVYCDNKFFPLAGNDYTINVTADSSGDIIESNETNNMSSKPVTAQWLGFKGNHYQDGRNITTWQFHDQDTINLVHSLGDSYYLSATTYPTWTEYEVNWTAGNFSIPSNDTCIKKARLYVYYCWDKTPGKNITDYLDLTFNDEPVPIPISAKYFDLKEEGSGTNVGMIAYDVKDVFKATSSNNAKVTNSYPGGGKVCMAGMLLAVVYNNPDEPERIIWINEGTDFLWAKSSYGVSPEEATAYAPFDGYVPLSILKKAKLIAVAPWGDKGDDKNRLYFNDGVWKGAWTGYNEPTQVSIAEVNVLPYLKESDNVAAYQDRGDFMSASNAFLVLEKAGHKSISVDPEETLTQPQDQFDVDIVVELFGQDVYGVQYTLKYDPSVLKAESQVTGDFFDPLNTAVIINKIDHPKGIVEYAETLTGEYVCIHGGKGSLARIQFTAIGEPGATSDLNISGVIIVDCNKTENIHFVVHNGTVEIYDNHPPEIECVGSKHEKNNAQKKFECWTTLCVNITDEGEKGYNVSYIRWAFGDGQYGTAEGGLPDDARDGTCLCKNHSYISWQYNASGRVAPRPDHNGQPHVVKYDPFVAMVTVTDDGCPPATDTEFFEVWVFMTGDANGDGKVNILDAVWIGKHFGDKCDGEAKDTCCDYMWSSNQKSGADLNNDCKINILDAVIVGTMWGHTAY